MFTLLVVLDVIRGGVSNSLGSVAAVAAFSRLRIQASAFRWCGFSGVKTDGGRRARRRCAWPIRRA